MKKVKGGEFKGVQINQAGYLRITTPGEHRWKLMHRRVMEILLEQTHPLTLFVLGIQLDGRGKLRKLPEFWDVHHVDGDKLKNAPSNLYLLDHIIHARAFDTGEVRHQRHKAIRLAVESVLKEAHDGKYRR